MCSLMALQLSFGAEVEMTLLTLNVDTLLLWQIAVEIGDLAMDRGYVDLGRIANRVKWNGVYDWNRVVRHVVVLCPLHLVQFDFRKGVASIGVMRVTVVEVRVYRVDQFLGDGKEVAFLHVLFCRAIVLFRYGSFRNGGVTLPIERIFF